VSVTTALGDFGTPPDAAAWAALMLAMLSLGLALHPVARRRIEALPANGVVAFLAVLAAALSGVYVAIYLRGGPRIVDATTYYLQARSLAGGHVSFDVPSPTASFRGRFLLASADGHSLAGIFPPGYPAVLALGFLAGVPLLVGPMIAAALVFATYALARRLFDDSRLALLAAALSVVCGVLRYHTADTMSHGWAALLFTVAVWSALGSSAWSAFAAGLSVGALVATRPVSGAVGAVVVVMALGRAPRLLLPLAAGAVGPLVLFVLEQHAATGAWFRSTQAAYYAVADAPPGCFRYGFGKGIGCLFEHGDFVKAHLADGYGFLAAAGTTLRRLKMHLADAGNTELFVPVLLYAIVVLSRGRAATRERLAPLAVAGVIAAYVPFYFDGNYPGGGARFYADVLPFEHVLLAFGLLRLGWGRFALPVALAGFGLHTAYDHGRLRDREGGRPMFEPAVLGRAHVKSGLLFVDTDHGFDLAFDPSRPLEARSLIVARRRGDARDSILWERLGRPSTFAYELSLAPGAAEPRVVPLALPNPSLLRFEAEGEWPPLVVDGGAVVPVFPPCASAHRALSMRPHAGNAIQVRLEISAPSAGKYRITSAWVTPAAGVGAARVTFSGLHWMVRWTGPPGACIALDGPPVQLSEGSDYVELNADSALDLDYLELSPVR
jgi:hypothetical protein